MDKTCGQDCFFKNRERGAGRLKFILVIAIIAIIGYVGYQYIPVAYQSYMFKDAMQNSVKSAAAFAQSEEWLRKKLRADGNDFNVPPDAQISVERNTDGRVQARVQYTRPVALLPGYTYAYNFDYTATSTEMYGTK